MIYPGLVHFEFCNGHMIVPLQAGRLQQQNDVGKRRLIFICVCLVYAHGCKDAHGL
jgi:hypothetical protein